MVRKPVEPSSDGLFYYNVHDLVLVVSNLRLSMIPEYFMRNTVHASCKSRFDLRFEQSSANEQKSMWTYSYAPFRGLSTRIGIAVNHSSVRVTFYDSVTRYLRRLRYPISQLIAGILQLQLMRQGFMILHGACLAAPDGEGVILAGLSNVGKTTTTLRLVRDHGFRFLSDDMFITNGITAFCFPRRLRLEYFKDISAVSKRTAYLKRGLLTVIGNIPLIPQLWVPAIEAEPVEAFQPIESVQLKTLWLLHRGEGAARFRRLNRDEALRQLVVQHRIGMVDYDFASSRIFQMYAFEDPQIDLGSLMSTQLALLRQIVDRCESYELVNQTPHFEDAIIQEMGD